MCFSIMAHTKQTGRKGADWPLPAVFPTADDSDESEHSRRSPVVKQGHVSKKPPIPKKMSIEDRIRKEQRKTEMSCSKAYFAK